MNFHTISNYYEQLVLQDIQDTLGTVTIDDPEFLEDVACLALNQLPARYVRRSSDDTDFLSSKEREQIAESVHRAVQAAARQVARHRRRPSRLS
jgi:competence protein ComFB